MMLVLMMVMMTMMIVMQRAVGNDMVTGISSVVAVMLIHTADFNDLGTLDDDESV